jgi:RNA polymerase sigma-70 factor, ECF subfamily
MGDAVAPKGIACAAPPRAPAAAASADAPPEVGSGEGARRAIDATLVRELVDAHHRFIWRLLGRLGVPSADLDDATQQVFMVLTQRSDLQILVGRERAFLFGVALKVARTLKRSRSRRREYGTVPDVVDPSSSPEELSEQHRARRLLDQILERMPEGLRLPFVLYELDDMSAAEIAVLLELPAGTVASRLRRAREWFQRRVQQLQVQRAHPRGGS